MFLTRAIELFWIALNFAGFYFSHNDVIINDYSRHIRMKTWQHQIDAYYKQRRQWDSKVLSTIHWKALEQWLDSLKMLRKIRAMKFIHQWQYVKYQELKFKESNGEVDAPTGKCPYGYNEVEHHAHFLYCTQNAAVEYRKIRRNVLINKILKLHTCPRIIIIMVTRTNVFIAKREDYI